MKNKILRALLSGVIAIAIWAYVVTVVSPNYDADFSNVPVTVQSEGLLHDRGLMITHIDTTEVDLKLEGSRIDLNKLSSSNIGITVDASRIDGPGTHTLTFSVTYPGDVPQNAVNILSSNPSRVTVTVENRISKPVPVEAQYLGNVAENFMADKENKILDHTEINITGPEAVIDQIQKAMILVDLEGRNESINEVYPITLCNADNEPVDVQHVTTDFGEVNLTMNIMRVKQVDLVVKLIEGGGATAKNCLVKVEPASIWISGSDSVLEGIDSIEIATLDLSTIAEDVVLTYTIKLPEGVTDETGVTEAEVDVKFQDLTTRYLTVTNFTMVNVPANMKAELLTKQLEVQIRGPQAKIDALEAEMLTAQADFSEVETGAVKVKVTILCTDPECGAVGTYTVSATVRETN